MADISILHARSRVNSHRGARRSCADPPGMCDSGIRTDPPPRGHHAPRPREPIAKLPVVLVAGGWTEHCCTE